MGEPIRKNMDWADFQTNRLEYDTVNGKYVDYLLTDIFPKVEAEIGCQLSPNPQHRIIGGISSGGCCAFNAAFQRPDIFGCVLSVCGSYVNFRGMHNLITMVRAEPRRPIRVYLQSGVNDMEGPQGHWPTQNKALAQSLEYANYDFHFEFGCGGHTEAHIKSKIT